MRRSAGSPLRAVGFLGVLAAALVLCLVPPSLFADTGADDGASTLPTDIEIPESVRRLPDSLEVRFGDGRLPIVAPIRKREGAYLRLGDIGRICGQGFVWNPDTDTSYMVILDAANVAAEPLAEIHIPRRVVSGFHSSWIPDRG